MKGNENVGHPQSSFPESPLIPNSSTPNQSELFSETIMFPTHLGKHNDVPKPAAGHGIPVSEHANDLNKRTPSNWSSQMESPLKNPFCIKSTLQEASTKHSSKLEESTEEPQSERAPPPPPRKDSLLTHAGDFLDDQRSISTIMKNNAVTNLNYMDMNGIHTELSSANSLGRPEHVYKIVQRQQNFQTAPNKIRSHATQSAKRNGRTGRETEPSKTAKTLDSRHIGPTLKNRDMKGSNADKILYKSMMQHLPPTMRIQSDWKEHFSDEDEDNTTDEGQYSSIAYSLEDIVTELRNSDEKTKHENI